MHVPPPMCSVGTSAPPEGAAAIAGDADARAIAVTAARVNVVMVLRIMGGLLGGV